MFQHVAAIRDVEASVGKGEGLTRRTLVVDGEPFIGRMGSRGCQRLVGRVYSYYRTAQAGEFLCQEAPATADIQDPQVSWDQAKLINQDPAHIAEPRGIEGGQRVKEAALIPPTIGHPIVNRVIDGHRTIQTTAAQPVGRCRAECGSAKRRVLGSFSDRLYLDLIDNRCDILTIEVLSNDSKEVRLATAGQLENGIRPKAKGVITRSHANAL
jgi:hypothetical protein